MVAPQEQQTATGVTEMGVHLAGTKADSPKGGIRAPSKSMEDERKDDEIYRGLG